MAAMTSTATDTFARFVDVLADAMDDHDADAAALAPRVHLSRFHCHRLVSAAAGEPPAALRRRILLERAAYQLITTDHDVLQVAMEAGAPRPGARDRGRGQAGRDFVDALCDPPQIFTYGGMVAHVLMFAAHRRVLVCGALADAGIQDLGAGDPMTWVAQPA
jgi:hypothetical protein